MEGIISPVIISLKVSLIASSVTFLLGGAISWLFARKSFWGKDILETLVLLPMVLPPSTMGYILLTLFGKRGIFGKILEVLGIPFLFTTKAAVLAAVVVSLPLMVQNGKAAFQSVNLNYEQAARSLGANEWKVFRRVTMPLALPGLVAGWVLSFARALGEFGATMMIVGNLPGRTQTIPIAMYYAVEMGDYQKANLLMIIVVVFSFTLLFVLNRWMKERRLY